MKINKFIGTCIGIIVCSTFSVSAFGGAFDNPTLGIKSMGMGAATTGVADDASAVFFNPAGMAFNEKNIWYAEVFAYYAPTKFEYTENPHTDKSDEAFIIPGIFITKRFDNWAFGFGSYIPYAGGGTAYDNFQNEGYDLESYAGWFAFTPAVSYRLSQAFSVGLGLSLYMGKMEDEGLMGESEFDGIAGYGGHIGLLYRPTKDFGIGFTVRSPVPIEMDGTITPAITDMEIDSEVEFTFPSSFTFGFGYRPSANLTVAFSSTYALWNHMDEIKIKPEGQASIGQPTGYQNNWVLGLGMEYVTKNNFIIRSGLKFDQGATEEKYLDARANDVDKLTPGLSIGYNITESVELNMTGLVVFGFEEEYHQKKYDQDNYAFIVGFRYKAR